MPVVFRHGSWRLQFYSNEGSPREPAHIHALRDGKDAKFWLWPEVHLAYNDGLSATEIGAIAKVIAERRDEIQRKWNDFFGDAD